MSSMWTPGGGLESHADFMKRTLTPEQLQGAEYVLRMLNGEPRITRATAEHWYEEVAIAMGSKAVFPRDKKKAKA